MVSEIWAAGMDKAGSGRKMMRHASENAYNNITTFSDQWSTIFCITQHIFTLSGKMPHLEVFGQFANILVFASLRDHSILQRS